MGPVRIVVVDDHPVIRSGLRGDLGADFDVIGEAGDAATAIVIIDELRPDLVVCDVHLPGGGITVVQACAGQVPVVMLSVSTEETDVLDAIAAGAIGYLSKTTPVAELRVLLADAANGHPAFSPALAMLVLGEFRRLAKDRVAHDPLSDREREVLGLVTRHFTNREIAAELHLSIRTIENHVRSIMAKLQLNRRTQLVRWGFEQGLGDASDLPHPNL